MERRLGDPETSGVESWVEQTLERHRGLLQQIRRQFELLRSIHDSRFQPARLKDGRAVALSFVWLHSDVTSKPGKSL